MSYTNDPRFPMGRPVITPAAQATLEAAGIEGVALLARHMRGDWGDLFVDDATANELALLTGKRLLSSYILPDGRSKIWIITEADRSVTTILRPEEY
ncbi:hypothetical protein [Burkholderia vietnamiensis]|uniref:hypothetical protein n=1 Tax=Burkholderia vietnamiensis TaxID=60552 RepID=UPI0007572195|nr:hypothetical protein [Burkholderia vietnamiensis]KVE69750.1 hypothetical protein WI98_01110 [Burkholderia vietnamiensis]